MSTITEALAELKTLDRRIATKREFIRNYLFYFDNLKDPFEKDGGSGSKVKEEMQSMSDLEARAVALRRAIQSANEQTTVSVGTSEMTIADWLVWRREIAPLRERFLKDLRARINAGRDALNRQQYNLTNDSQKVNMVVNLDEASLNKEIENFDKVMGDLDGQLSLKNATVMVNV